MNGSVYSTRATSDILGSTSYSGRASARPLFFVMSQPPISEGDCPAGHACDRCATPAVVRVRHGALLRRLCARCWYDAQVAYGLIRPPARKKGA